jgi:hypothetical protein
MVGPNVIRGKPTQLGIETAGSLRGNQAGHANSAPRDSQRSGPAQKDSTAAYSESGQLIAEAFKEDASARPLGENPFPSEHPAHEPFEEGTWVAKRSLNRVRLKTLNSIPNPEADLVQAILTFRVRMFSPCAFGALLIVGNEETGGVYERLIDKLAEYTLHDTLQKGQLKDPRANPASHPLFRPEILPRMEGDLKLALMKAVTHYKGRAAKRVLQSMQMRRTLAGESEQRASESTKISAAASYPERASWFQNELAVREWSVHDFQAQGGPDWKTSRKILDGLWVSRGVLEKTAAALSKKKKRVLLRDIPQT